MGGEDGAARMLDGVFVAIVQETNPEVASGDGALGRCRIAQQEEQTKTKN